LVSQRDIVEVIFDLPQGELKHPAIVLSNNDVIALEGYFVCVMLTSEDYDDEYSFMLDGHMFNKPLNSKSQARLHLIGWFRTTDVVKNSHYNHQMKVEYFKELVKQINSTTFNCI
jgi:mRNA-degrading endonuclease toxin of MazEF toxin-antitoxin module